MLKFYGHPLSTPSNKVVFCLAALKLEFEQNIVDLQSGEQRSESFIALNPFSKVPVINDHGFVLYESGAIVRYLASRESSTLYPENPQVRAIVEQWMDFSTHLLLLAIQKVFFNRVLAPVLQVPVDEAAINAGLQQLESYLPAIEQQLTDREFVCTDTLSLADITLVSVLDSCAVAKIDLSPYPAIDGWQKKMTQQDFYTQTHSHYGAGIFA